MKIRPWQRYLVGRCKRLSGLFAICTRTTVVSTRSFLLVLTCLTRERTINLYLPEKYVQKYIVKNLIFEEMSPAKTEIHFWNKFSTWRALTLATDEKLATLITFFTLNLAPCLQIKTFSVKRNSKLSEKPLPTYFLD